MAEVFFYLTSASVGYVIGRAGHVFGGHIKTLHHWIYGLLLIILGGFGVYYRMSLGVAALLFGIGLFVSDLKDFLALKVYGADEDGPKWFWGID